MTTMFRIRNIATVLGLVCMLAFQVTPVLAQQQPPPAQGASGGFADSLQKGLSNAAPKELQGSGATTDLSVLVGRIISAALGLLGVILFGYFLYGGFLWMTAGGETKKVDLAQAHIKNAVIGLIIIVLSYAASDFVIRSLSKVLNPS